VGQPSPLARLISAVENEPELVAPIMGEVPAVSAALAHPPVLGITGTGGAGKISLSMRLVRRFLRDFPRKGARRRLRRPVAAEDRRRAARRPHPHERGHVRTRVYMRSMATRQANVALSRVTSEALRVLRAASYDLILLESSGIGQSDTEITSTPMSRST
jgi:methylmalonyl-CoA mutase